jgi:hypothetical protein
MISDSSSLHMDPLKGRRLKQINAPTQSQYVSMNLKRSGTGRFLGTYSSVSGQSRPQAAPPPATIPAQALKSDSSSQLETTGFAFVLTVSYSDHICA